MFHKVDAHSCKNIKQIRTQNKRRKMLIFNSNINTNKYNQSIIKKHSSQLESKDTTTNRKRPVPLTDHNKQFLKSLGLKLNFYNE